MPSMWLGWIPDFAVLHALRASRSDRGTRWSTVAAYGSSESISRDSAPFGSIGAVARASCGAFLMGRRYLNG
jgi:hypothetical protein